MQKLEEIDPELFLYELYDAEGLSYLDPHDLAVCSIGYCDAGRLLVRPKSGECALMVELPDHDKIWFHVDPKTIELINRRRERYG